MSILIKGMEMPKDYSVIVKIFPDGRVGTIPYVQWFKVDLIPGTQAVPVPPHGRLIDADALAVHKFAGAEHDISIADGGACYRRGWNDAIEAIMENAETITGGE